SANRGECMQPCRRKWYVKNQDGELIYEGERFLNARDLCMVEHIDKLLKTGAVSFKIEGRMKDANYVSTVVKVYREAIDKFDKSRIKEWKERLSSVFNRGFSTGFYFNIPNNEIELQNDGNVSELKKTTSGIVEHYYSKLGVAQIRLTGASLEKGDTIIIEGNTTYLKQRLDSMQINKKEITKAEKGKTIAVKVNDRVRKNDELYKMAKKNGTRKNSK
ncbi:MAG: U32 family peptidase, partial [Candidatus Nanoarchaeia archaeon]|nr:U32 family peptidase [Candidatus Nanoarchaeia archaeon]